MLYGDASVSVQVRSSVAMSALILNRLYYENVTLTDTAISLLQLQSDINTTAQMDFPMSCSSHTMPFLRQLYWLKA